MVGNSVVPTGFTPGGGGFAHGAGGFHGGGGAFHGCVIPPEACYLCSQESLTLLAKLVEAEIAGLETERTDRLF